MIELTTRQLSDLISDKLEELEEETSLENPTTESKFPCRTINTPLERILKTRNAIPIAKQFQITISCWNKTQRATMEMATKTDEKLREYNLIRTSTSPITFDRIIQKYRIITTYEVRWNGLTNSFEVIR